MSQMFRTITYLGSNADVAQSLNMPFVMLFVVFGGFLIPRSKVQDWLIWAYYLSPFSVRRENGNRRTSASSSIQSSK